MSKPNNRLFINEKEIDEKMYDADGVCNALLKLNISHGDIVELEPFTENEDMDVSIYKKEFHCKEYIVKKLKKMVKRTLNGDYYYYVIVHLSDN